MPIQTFNLTGESKPTEQTNFATALSRLHAQYFGGDPRTVRVEFVFPGKLADQGIFPAAGKLSEGVVCRVS